MRLPLAIASLSLAALLSCQTCPDGDTSGSLFCHAGDCAAGESVCEGICSNPQTDRDNCGTCGNQCGDGMTCSNGMCVEGCEGGLVSCSGSCVDTMTDEANCGACGTTGTEHVCAAAETCTGGDCICGTGVVCAGVCTNPMTDNMHCGATTDCMGGNTGTTCMATEGCVNGTCVSRLLYRGSLPATKGLWTYRGMTGIPGANADCEAHWTGSSICTYEKLLMASQRPVPETMGATDYNGAAVTKWWIDDPAAVRTQRCAANATPDVPWSYETQDQGHVGKFVMLTPATGAISIVQVMLPSCNDAKHVPCCSTVLAP